MNWWCYKHVRLDRYSEDIKQKDKKECKARSKSLNIALGLRRQAYLFGHCAGDGSLLPSAVLLQVVSEVSDGNNRAGSRPSHAVHALVGH